MRSPSEAGLERGRSFRSGFRRGEGAAVECEISSKTFMLLKLRKIYAAIFECQGRNSSK